MLNTGRITWLFLAFALTKVPASAQIVDAIEGPEDDRYEVYSTLLDSLYSQTARDAHLVANTTSGAELVDVGSTPLRARQPFPGFSASLMESFERANHSAHILTQRFTTKLPVVLMDSTQIAAVDEQRGDWGDNPVPQAAHGLVMFSAVGFSGDQREAMVRVTFRCGIGCGSVQVVLLAKVEGGWRVVDGDEVPVP